MSNQIKNDRNKDNGDKDYHFSKGKTGRIVRWLLRIGKRPETVDETVTAPAVLTLMAFLWADKHPDCGQLPIWVYVASVAAAGTWYGLVRGDVVDGPRTKCARMKSSPSTTHGATYGNDFDDWPRPGQECFSGAW
uniref:hypothetical protein n=1 Tax=Komagataeibacter xylinus TaxID=28448 RepID=UPI001A936876